MARLKRHADEEQTTAVADWVRQIERDFSCRVRIVCNVTGPAAKLGIRTEACDVAGERLVGVRVQCKGSYPSSYATSYLGTLLKLLIELHKECEDYENVCAGLPSSKGVLSKTAQNTVCQSQEPQTDPLTPLKWD